MYFTAIFNGAQANPTAIQQVLAAAGPNSTIIVTQPKR